MLAEVQDGSSGRCQEGLLLVMIAFHYNLLNRSRDHAIILRSFNLLMIEAKHELRYNYTELLYLIEEMLFVEAFSDWLLLNLNWIISGAPNHDGAAAPLSAKKTSERIERKRQRVDGDLRQTVRFCFFTAGYQ